MSFRLRALLFAVFVFSGAAGLVYEIAWVRRLSLVFGSTTLAISTVLAAFMGGLALGSYFIGRYADRHASRAIRLYGTIEIAIALCAAAMPALIRMVQYLYLPLAPGLESSPQLFFADLPHPEVAAYTITSGSSLRSSRPSAVRAARTTR